MTPVAHEPSSPSAPSAGPPDDDPPRVGRLRFWAIVALAAIVIAVPTVLYVTLSSRTTTPEPRALPPGKVVSYYPPTAAWSYMWTRFDGEAIASDLRRAHALGFDTVRIFVPPSAFGYPKPSRVMQARLRDVVASAAAAHMKVGLSLFDRFQDYDDHDGSRTWIRAILAPYADDPRISFVEVHNEINPADGHARSWFAAMIAAARKAAPRVPIVASVPGSSGVAGLKKLANALATAPPDAYSLHYYRDPSYLVTTLRRAEKAVAPVRLVLGEVGYSTAADNPSTPGTPATAWAQQAQQSLVLRAAFDATRRLALPPPGIWTLFDLRRTAIPPAIAARNRSGQQAYGVLHANGRPKPAAAAVRAFLRYNAISTDINADFTRGGMTRTGPQPTDWRSFDASEGSLLWDPSVGHDAPGSVRLARTTGSRGRVPSYYQRLWSVEIRRHQSYLLSAWARGKGIVGNDRIAVSWFDADGRYLKQKESQPLPTGDPGWTQLVVKVSPPPGAAALEVHLKSSHEAGTVWFDDVAIQ